MERATTISKEVPSIALIEQSETRGRKNLVRRYKNDLNETHRIDTTAEVFLSEQIQKYKREKDMEDLPRTARDLAVTRFVQYRNTLVEANLSLVVKEARYYSRHQQALEEVDLINIGNLGLIHAAEEYDYTRETVFSTSATIEIRKAMRRAIAEQSRTIRLPEHAHYTVRKVEKWQQRSLVESGRRLTDEEVVAELRKSPDPATRHTQLATLKAMQQAERVISLSAPIGARDGSEEDLVMADTIQSLVQVEKTTTRAVSNSQLRHHFLQFIATLTPRQQEVMLVRCGLADGKFKTLPETGAILGTSDKNIGMIFNKVLRILRSSEYAPILASYL